MLEFLRKAGKTWIAKLLLILLVASFGIWGIQSSIFSGANEAVVTVGDQKVSNVEFRIAYNSAMANLSRQFGRRLTLEQARMFGIESIVLNQLVSGATLDQLADDMKLGLSEDRLLQLIQDEPAFKDPSGSFSRNLMQQRLYNAGIRPEDYLVAKSREAVRTQIADAVSSGFEAPKTLVDALKAHAYETRSIDYLLIGKDQIPPVAAPADDVLKSWFATNQSKYQAPEYRKVTYVTLQPADIADESAISDNAIQEDYEKRKDSYRTPESRTIEQLTFANKEAADEAAAKLAAGTTFDQLVSDQGKTATDVLLGDFTRDKMPTPSMADAAFAVAANGGTTPVVDGVVGPVILRVSNIRPEQVKSLDEVKDEIRKALALNLANDEIQAVYDRFEDTRASGATLGEGAKQLQLKAVTIPAVDASGQDMQGAEIKDLPGGNKLIDEVFKTEVGVEPLPLHLDNGGYVWFEVDEITPKRDRTLDEVKDTVVADWTAEQQRSELAKKAAELVKQIRDGKSIQDVATELSIAVESKSGVQRGMTDAVLSANAISAAFGGPEGYVSSAVDADGSGQVVLKVTGVQDNAPVDPLENKDQQLQQLANAVGDDILDQLVGELRGDYGVSFNRTLANQLMVQQ